MDDDLISLEAELQRLRPIGASARLRTAIDRELRPRPALPRWAWLTLPAAAALALALFPWRSPSSGIARPADQAVAAATSPATGVFDPVAAENVLVDSQDEGVVTLGDGTPARRIRQLYVDTITWKNPRTQASLQWTLPREEVCVLPISYQ